MSSTYEAGDLCVYCGNDTGWGSGRFVNRIPADVDSESSFLPDEDKASFRSVDGYACAECMEVPCVKCGEPIALDEDHDLDPENQDGMFDRYHFDCLPAESQALYA
jgi:hypothetical protein